VLDKTGTITKGQPAVTDVAAFNEHPEDRVVYYAASLEQGSEHPLARAVVKAALERGVELSQPAGFQALKGRGVTGAVDGVEVAVGKPGLVGSGLPAEAEADSTGSKPRPRRWWPWASVAS